MFCEFLDLFFAGLLVIFSAVYLLLIKQVVFVDFFNRKAFGSPLSLPLGMFVFHALKVELVIDF